MKNHKIFCLNFSKESSEVNIKNDAEKYPIKKDYLYDMISLDSFSHLVSRKFHQKKEFNKNKQYIVHIHSANFLKEYSEKNKDIFGIIAFVQLTYRKLNSTDIQYVLDRYKEIIKYTDDINIKNFIYFRISQIKLDIKDFQGALIDLNSIKGYSWNFFIDIYKRTICKFYKIKSIKSN